MSFYTSRLLFLALLLACVSCAGSADGTLIEYVGLDGSVVECTDGEIEVTTLTGCFRAVRVPSATQSVKFKVNGEVTAVENQSPYHSYKDQQGKPNFRLHREASYIVAAVPYTQNGGRGRALAGANIRVRFKLKDDPAPDPEPEPPKPDPEPEPEPPKPDPDPPTPPLPRPGLNGRYFALKPGEKNRNISEQQLRMPVIAGLTIRFRPGDILRDDGSFDWAYLDGQVNLCRKTGDRYTLLCMSGGGGSVDIYVKIIRDCGQRYKDCWGWHVTGRTPNGTSEELHWGSGLNASVEADNKRLITESAMAFPNARILHALGTDVNGGMERIVAHGAQVCGSRYLVKHNRLKAFEPGSTPQVWLNLNFNRQLVNYCRKYGVSMGFEMVGGTVERHPRNRNVSRCGSEDIMDSIANARELARRAGLNPDEIYCAVYQPDFGELR